MGVTHIIYFGYIFHETWFELKEQLYRQDLRGKCTLSQCVLDW